MREQAVFRSSLLPWLLLAPTLVILAVFLYWPALDTLRLSTFQSNFIFQSEIFVGLRNFRDLLSDPAWRQSLVQTAVFAALVVVIGLGISLALATLATQAVRGARGYRLLLIYPYALSPAIAGTLWLFLFNPEVGLVNALLSDMVGVRPRWLDSPFLAFGLVVAAAVWKNLGYNIVFYIAALQNLPRDVLEAARIDGANGWQVFWKITFPLLSPMTFFLVFTNVVYALFDVFGLVDILTRGGPVYGETGITTFLVYRLYLDGFENFKTGLAAAQGVLLLVMVAAITLLQFRLAGRKVHYGA